MTYMAKVTKKVVKEVKKVVKEPSKCSDCSGSGLLDANTLCPTCSGTGQA